MSGRGGKSIVNELFPYSFGANNLPLKVGSASYIGTWLPRVLSVDAPVPDYYAKVLPAVRLSGRLLCRIWCFR